MKNMTRIAATVVVALLLAFRAQADPVNLIGDWTQGFTSDYVFGNILDPGTMSWTNTHPYWQDAVGAPGSSVLYVNSRDDEASTVWQKTFNAPADSQVTVTSWVANVCCTLASGLNYPGSVLQFLLDGSLFFEAPTDGAGVMQAFTASFWAGDGGPFTLSLRNQSMCYNGCDFAMGETSVTSVPTPEPATIGLMLTGLGFAWRQRKRRQAA